MTPRDKIYADVALIAQMHGFKLNDMITKPSRRCTTPAKIECITMLRSLGKSWAQIGEIMHRTSPSVAQIFKYVRKDHELDNVS